MQQNITILVIGSKNFDDYCYFEEKMYQVLEPFFEENFQITIREQEINTVDTFAIRFAKENNCILERYKIKWDKYGKSAAYENIKQMIFGDNVQSTTNKLVCFYRKNDKKADKEATEKILDEFKSIIDLEHIGPNYYIFTQSK